MHTPTPLPPAPGLPVSTEEPSDADIQLAIEANNAFVERLELIKAQAEATLDD